MKILHVISSMTQRYGGPALTTWLTVKGLLARGAEVTILTYAPQPPDTLIVRSEAIRLLPALSSWERRFAYSAALRYELDHQRDVGLYHVQGLWQYPGYQTAVTAQKKNCPYVITLHGTLYPEALKASAMVKKTALRLYQRRQLQEAACIHVTCREEMLHYRALGFTNPVALIPNPLDWREMTEFVVPDGRKRVGYLGRVHPRKNIDRLIEVWSRMQEPDGELLIMGEGDPSYMERLKQQAAGLKLTNVRFCGFVSGAEKERLLASLTCLVVPSDFENFGMIIPEALVQHVPVIASTGTPWEELNSRDCGWWIPNDVETLTATLGKALALDEATRCEMGMRGKQLVAEKYTVDAVASQMEQLYGWLTAGGDKPDFVYV